MFCLLTPQARCSLQADRRKSELRSVYYVTLAKSDWRTTLIVLEYTSEQYFEITNVHTPSNDATARGRAKKVDLFSRNFANLKKKPR